MIIFHGGCHGCTQQERYGVNFCNGCQYRYAEWKKPNLKDSTKIEKEKRMKKFKLNQAVRILGKSAGDTLEESGYKVGDTARIVEYGTSTFDYLIRGRHNRLQYGFKEIDLDYVFKEGDEVTILKKTCYGSMESNNWTKGDIGYYKRWDNEYKCHIVIHNPNDIGGDAFSPTDIVPYELKNVKTKFKVGDSVQFSEYGFNSFIDRYPSSMLYMKMDDIGIIDSKYAGPMNYDWTVHFDNGKKWNVKNEDIQLALIKELKYKFVKNFRPIDLISFESTASYGPTLSEKDKFNKRVIEKGISLYHTIAMNQDFIDYFTSYSCFKTWLLKEGYIKENKPDFVPFKIEIDIESDEMFWTLYHRLNIRKTAFDIYKTSNNYKCTLKGTDRLFNIVNAYSNKVDISKK